MEVDIVTYGDADYLLTQTVSPAPGSNPLHMQVRTVAADPTVWIECTTANGLIAVSGSDVTVTIPQAKLLNLPPGQYVYSVIMSSNAGANRTEMFRGTITHNAGPTRWAAGTP